MDQVNVNIRMDRDLKEKLERECREFGMNITTAFTIFAKKVTREHCIPFEINSDPFFTDSDIDRLIRAKEALDAGKGVEHDMIEVD